VLASISTSMARPAAISSVAQPDANLETGYLHHAQRGDRDHMARVLKGLRRNSSGRNRIAEPSGGIA
jgi:hypothetical protein